ncbi:hypothetical protein [Rhizobium halophytocola]|uniref:Biotin transporter BioY n=1 Tax=Rhizobium halophytocola TaxID=735519 RepID=A0ABS4E0M1_9HYPH|nr:hypothetical protein [Rhizobium halophytocola]MBP1851489.1 hypothetical protein [Rhizobium halophytocola]
MSGLETAIRSALERSDRENAEQRARIYQSARQALEAGLHKKQIADRTVIEGQRRQLEEIIHKIELEERQRLSAAAPAIDGGAEPSMTSGRPEALSPESDALHDTHRRPESGSLDGVHAMRADAGAPTAAPAAGVPEGLDFGAEAVSRTRKRGSGLFSRLFILAILLAAVGMGAWWVYSSGVLLPPSSRDTSLPAPQPTASAEDYNPAPANGANPFEEHKTFNGDWLTVFTPERIAALKPRANATVDIVGKGENQAARLLANSGDDDGRVAITVPVDVLAQMAGKTSTIAVTMKSSSDDPTRIAISCDFGPMGECPRHRFTINSERLDILFRVSFDAASAPSTPGLLLLNPDLTGKGGGVDIFGIRVLPGN